MSTGYGRKCPLSHHKQTFAAATGHMVAARFDLGYRSSMAEEERTMAGWRLADMPDLSGKQAVVTGGSAGLGLRSALELARRGAGVTIASRDAGRAAAALDGIRAEVPGAEVAFLPLDLSDVASVARFAGDYARGHDRLDILMNNGGVVLLDKLARSPDGHELHMAVNHFGHFALTCRLSGLLTATPRARVVTLTSGLYRRGAIRFDDLDWRRRVYSPFEAYGDSKLANLLFTHTLQRRFERAGVDAVAVAAHPGLTGTDRQQGRGGIAGLLGRWIASPVAIGVAPQLRATTDPAVRGGELYGPRFFVRGAAVRQAPTTTATDDDVAERLWAVSEGVTGCSFG